MNGKEQNMNRKLIMQRTTMAVLIAAASAAGASQAAGGTQASPEFQKLDTNRDGYLSRGETRKLRDFDAAFSEADDNRDGKLDAAEFVKAQSIQDRLVAGRFLDDSVITARVKAALLKDPVVSALAVSVETSKGTVLLSGFVDSEGQLRRAQEIAAGVPGVVTVRNGLVVKS